MEHVEMCGDMSDKEYEADEEEEEDQESSCATNTSKQPLQRSSSSSSSVTSRQDEDQDCSKLAAQPLSCTQLRRWLKEMEGKIEPVSIRQVGEWTLTERRDRLADIQEHLLDIEVKGESIRSGYNFYTGKKKSAKLQQVSKLDRRWHKLWLNCAEWKCLLEVGIEQQGEEILSLSLSSTSPSSSSAESSSPSILSTLVKPVSKQVSSIKVSRLFPTTTPRPSTYTMEPENSAELAATAAHKQVTTANSDINSNSKTSVERQSVKVSNSQSLANWNATSDDYAVVSEIKTETSLCTKTTKSCNKSSYAEPLHDLAKGENCYSIDVSQVSDFWDQETYLSEHNYDEVLDVETAKIILNFGDDYRNFIESNSEVQSPRVLELGKKKRSFRTRLESERSKLKDDSNSEDDCADVFKVISDLKIDVDKYEDDYRTWRLKGFESFEKAGHIESVLQKCEGSCKFLTNIHRETTSSNNFVARKRSREIRFLQNRWKLLENLSRKDQKLKSVYLTIKQDIETLKEDLVEHQKKVKVNERKCVNDLRKYLRFYKDSNIKLTRFKSRLFELNLAVHTLLADVSNNSEDEVKYLEVDRMKDDVVELYNVWDKCMMDVSSRVLKAEESIKSVNKIERDLSELSEFLKKETKMLADEISISDRSNCKHLTIDDSGISDESGDIFNDVDIIAKEENLRNLKSCVRKISKTISPNSSVILGINAALKESAEQLENLKIFVKVKKTTYYDTATAEVDKNTKVKSRNTFWLRVKKFSKFFTFLLAVLLLLLVLISPSCCEFRNTMLLFYPRLSYVNGPPPI
eukprot:GFUD01085778.1.p1 GENE.GFUD01085778.1~~GFUD01085778.1.p1  ORF type:complete len:804 (+),score=252.73 GFUD01085778.1:389-2800(+)